MNGINTSVSAVTSAPRAEIFEIFADPTAWVDWIGPVMSAEPDVSSALAADGPQAWFIDVGIKLGPFKKTARVRLELIEQVPGRCAKFRRVERQINDEGAQNAPEPALEIGVMLSDRDVDGQTLVETTLRFGGKFPPGVEPIVRSEMRRTIERMSARWGRAF